MNNYEREALAYMLGLDGWDFGNDEDGPLPGINLDPWNDREIASWFEDVLPKGWKEWRTNPIVRICVAIYTVPETLDVDGVPWTVAGSHEIGESECPCKGEGDEPCADCKWCDGDGYLYFGCETRLALLLPPEDLREDAEDDEDDEDDADSEDDDEKAS